MTEVAVGLTIEQRARRVLALSELRKFAIDAYNREKAALAELMEPGDTKRPTIGDSGPVGSVSMSMPLSRAAVTDQQAFDRWCVEHHPEHAVVTITIRPEAWPDGIDARNFDADAVHTALATGDVDAVSVDVRPSAVIVKQVLDFATDHRAAIDRAGEFVDGLTMVRGQPTLSARVTAKGAPILHEAMAAASGTGVTLAELTGGAA